MGIKKAAAIATAKKRNHTGVCRSVVITRMAEVQTISVVHCYRREILRSLPASKLRASVPKYHDVGTLS